jgi:hypothetical protein
MKIIILIIISIIFYSCTHSLNYSHYTIVGVTKYHILKDTIKNARVLEINVKKCDSIIYAAGIFIKTLSNDTLLIYEICFENKLIEIGEIVNVAPYDIIPYFDMFVGDTIRYNPTVFQKRVNTYSFGKILRMQ